MNNNNVNESSSLYDDIRKTQYIQQSSTNPNRVLNNAFPVNIYNNYQKKLKNILIILQVKGIRLQLRFHQIIY